MPQYELVDATSCFNISASAGAGSNQAFVTYLPKCVSSVFSWLPLFWQNRSKLQASPNRALLYEF
jgi:hypothetical protein